MKFERFTQHGEGINSDAIEAFVKEVSNKKNEFLGMELFDSDVYALVYLLGVSLLVNFILIRLIYYPFSEKRREYLFSFLLTGTVVFVLGFILKSKQIETGIAFGLFAVFSIIRFRTSLIPVKEMAYFFAVIGVSLMLALAKKINLSIVEVSVIVGVVLISALLMELFLKKPNNMQAEEENEESEASKFQTKTIVYGLLDNLKPENRGTLLDDLKIKTGLDIQKVEVGSINLKKGEANLKIYYPPNKA